MTDSTKPTKVTPSKADSPSKVQRAFGLIRPGNRQESRGFQWTTSADPVQQVEVNIDEPVTTGGGVTTSATRNYVFAQYVYYHDFCDWNMGN